MSELNDISDIFPELSPSTVKLAGENAKETGSKLNPLKVSFTVPARISQELRTDIDRLVELVTFRDAVCSSAQPIGKTMAGEVFELIPLIDQQQEMSRMSDGPSLSNWKRVSHLANREIAELEAKLPFSNRDTPSYIQQAKSFAYDLRTSDLVARTTSMFSFILSKISVAKNGTYEVPTNVRGVFRLDGKSEIVDILTVPLDDLVRGYVVDSADTTDRLGRLFRDIKFEVERYNDLVKSVTRNERYVVGTKTISYIILGLIDQVMQWYQSSANLFGIKKALDDIDRLEQRLEQKDYGTIVQSIDSLYDAAERLMFFNEYASSKENLFEVLIELIDLTRG